MLKLSHIPVFSRTKMLTHDFNKGMIVKKGFYMKIYLAQHAKAKSEEEDLSRPLNDEGIKDVKKICEFLKPLKIKVNAIYHSEKLRAKQTAMFINEAVTSENGIIELKDLNPNDDPEKIFSFIMDQKKDFIIVGHLPYLAKLTGFLIAKDQNAEPVSFTQGCIACLEKNNEKEKFILQYLVRPDIL